MRGIVTVLNTPFDPKGAVDISALGRHADFALSAGVAGFLVPALAAEVETLTPGEREAMVAEVVRVAAGRVPVLAGASAPTREARVDNARRLARQGCDVVLVSLSGGPGFIDEIAAVADASGLPVMVQDWDAAGGGIPVPDLVTAFEKTDAFRYLKVETADAGPKYTRLKAETGGALHVSGGWAVQQLIEALDRGVDAFMPTAMHRTYVAIVAAHARGDRDAAVTLFRRLLPVLAFSNQNLGLSIRTFKRLLWRQGIYPTSDLRQDVPLPDAFQSRSMDDAVALAMQLEEELSRQGLSPAGGAA